MAKAMLFLPEIALLAGALGAFVLSVWGRPDRRAWEWSVLVAAVALGAAVTTIGLAGEPFFPRIFRVDAFSQWLKVALALGLLLTSLLGREPIAVRALARPDVPFFLMLATVGMMMLVSATELVTFYVALEMAAIGIYAAVAVHRDPAVGGEAAAKMIVFGVVMSAVTLYGLSLVLGCAGSPYFEDVARAATVSGGTSGLLRVGILLVLASLLFKLAVVPFHFWAPDVYERAPQTVVAFVATASKLAALGVILRIAGLVGATPAGIDRALWLLAIVSMTVGNLAALVQRDFRRLLGYSAAAHAGYVLLAVGALTESGTVAAVFYGVTYLVMSALVFVVVCAIDRDGGRSRIEDLAGLHERSPGLALLLLVALFALAGIPPTVGFAGKWFVFSAALERGQFGLVLVAAVNSTISLYYYLRIVRAAYLAPADGLPPVRVHAPEWVAGGVAAALTLAIGIWPQPLWEVARQAARGLFGG